MDNHEKHELLPIQRIGPQMVRDLAVLVALCASVAIASAFVGWAIAAWRAAL